MERISRSVYAECHAPGCCTHSFVETGDGLVMIDTPVVPSAAARWAREIERRGALRYIVNMEPHIDHFGGSSFFQGTLVARHETRDRIAATPLDEMVQMLAAGAPGSLPLPDSFRFRLPEITFSENLTLHAGDHTFQIIGVPGHTACQIAVYLPEERVLFTGDTVANRIVPSLHEALPFQWLDSLQKLQKLDCEVVVPGHGATGDSGLILHMAEALGAAIEEVKAGIDRGMSLKEAKDRITVFRDHDNFIPGERFRRWMDRVNVGRLYQLLKERE